MNTATRFPALLETFFNDRLIQQRQASPHTIASYRDSFRMLVQYAQRRLKKAPSDLAMEDLDAPFLGAFLNYLEKDGVAAHALEMSVSPPSTPSSAMWRCMSRSTVPWHNEFWPCLANDIQSARLSSSPVLKSRPCSPHRIELLGQAIETVP